MATGNPFTFFQIFQIDQIQINAADEKIADMVIV